MASRTDIANLALGHFGQSRITDIDQNSPSAEAVRDCWGLARDAVLRAHHWNFATGEAALVQLADAPLTGWTHQYALPPDFRRLVSCNGVLSGTRDAEFSVRGGVLVANCAQACIEYVRNVPECELWDPDFVMAFSFQLAELVAPRLSLDGGFGARLAQRKQDAGLTAMLSDAVESRPYVRRAQEGSQYFAAREEYAPGGMGAGSGGGGTRGPAGPAGAAATITVGSVTTGAAGTNATVTNSGTGSAAVLNFTIPRGEDGSGGGGGGSGTVTSVTASGGTTGLTFTGGPVTTSGTLTLSGTLALANGGTGATTAAAARTALGLAIGTDVAAEANYLRYDARLYPLGAFALRQTVASIAGVSAGISGATYNPRSNSVFVIRNVSGGDAHVYELDVNGTLLRTIAESGFQDTEAIEWIGWDAANAADVFVIAEEDHGTAAVESSLTLCRITPGATTVTKGAGGNVTVTTAYSGGTMGNLGVEAMAYDARRGVLYYTAEKRTAAGVNNTAGAVDAKIFQRSVNYAGTLAFGAESVLCSIAPLFSGTLTDVGDAAYDAGSDTILLLSDESDKLVRIDRTGAVVETLATPGNQPEGVALTPSGRTLWVTGENAEFYRYSLGWGDGEVLSTLTNTYFGNQSIGGTVTATAFSGGGAALTGLNAGNVTAGTLADARLSTVVRSAALGVTIDGAGAVPATGVKGYLVAPFACTITGWSIVADQTSPACTIDVWKVATGSALPVVGNSITASAKPALSTGNAVRSGTLTGWTTGISAGDVIGFNLDARANAHRITFLLEVVR